MSKKLMTGLLALVALAAMALPAVASASPEITHPTGTTLATGAKITGTNVGNTVLTSSLGNVECSKALMTGTLTKNSGTAVEGTISSASFKGTEGGAEEKCSGAFGSVAVTVTSLPWCIRATNTMAPDEFQVRGGACTEAAKAITFALHTSLFGTCTFERAAASPVTGTFRTHAAGDALLTITNVAFTRTSGFCPSEGKLDMSFTLETDKTIAEPLYIS
jgi:hypothetical protein